MQAAKDETVKAAINEFKRIKAGSKPSFNMALAIKPERAAESFTARMTDVEREVWAKALSLKFEDDERRLRRGD